MLIFCESICEDLTWELSVKLGHFSPVRFGICLLPLFFVSQLLDTLPILILVLILALTLFLLLVLSS